MPKDMTDAELLQAIRREASHWFNDTHLLLLEELIRRYAALQPEAKADV